MFLTALPALYESWPICPVCAPGSPHLSVDLSVFRANNPGGILFLGVFRSMICSLCLPVLSLSGPLLPGAGIGNTFSNRSGSKYLRLYGPVDAVVTIAIVVWKQPMSRRSWLCSDRTFLRQWLGLAHRPQVVVSPALEQCFPKSFL